jgi:N-carbamoyl-L-amino-acid hydrolase
MPDVSRERFVSWFGELAAIGHTETGWNRLAWSPLEAEARAWFSRTATSIGLEVQQDGAGTLWAVTDDAERGPWVCAGSHLDTQPDGGAYDGALGVVAALEAAATLLEAGVPRRHPLAVVAFVDEEGARFRTPTFASLAITGRLDIDHVLDVMGDAPAIYGVTRDSLASSRAQLDRIRCFFEVHVEQGRALVDRDLALGIADVLAPRQRWRVQFEGEANHAGTTAMADRRDALLPAARFALAVDEVARARPGAVGTVGRMEISPGSTNSVPGYRKRSSAARPPTRGPCSMLGCGSASRQQRSTGELPPAISRRMPAMTPGSWPWSGRPRWSSSAIRPVRVIRRASRRPRATAWPAPRCLRTPSERSCRPSNPVFHSASTDAPARRGQGVENLRKFPLRAGFGLGKCLPRLDAGLGNVAP